MAEPLPEPDRPDDALTADTLLGGKVVFHQLVTGYRAAIDAVLLAAAVPATGGDLVLDAGTGAGAGLLCLAWRVPECRIVGLERDSALANLARRNAAENRFSRRVEILDGDIAHPPAALVRGGFDRVMMNPPHLEPGRARAPADASRAAAFIEDAAGLEDWIGFADTMLCDRGTLTLVHRADRLDQLLAALLPQFGGIHVLPLWPARDRPAKRVIVHARKNSRGPAVLLPGLILHADDGRYTSRAEEILRDGDRLDL